MFHMQQPSEPTQTVEQSFGAEVNRFRTMQGMSQRAFAQKLSDQGMPVDASAVSRIESGARSVRLSEAMTIADVLEVDLDLLVEGSRTPSQEFKSLRRLADNSMNVLEGDAIEFIEAFKDANRYLQRHPELLADITDDDMGSPSSPDEYLDWIGRRMERNRERSLDHAIAGDREEAQHLNHLLTRFVAQCAITQDEFDQKSATIAARTRDAAASNLGGEEGDGEHSEEA